jgi:cardiolipin synthase (CMP-forming)
VQIDHVPAAQTSRVLTVPNGLSALRLLGVPVFLYLVLAVEEDAWALAVLAASGASDWLDGQLARKWGQVSRLGQVLDPAADRLYILATLLGLAIRGIIPWWLVPLLVGRDLMLAAFYPLLRRRGYGPLPVHFLGKAATFNLLYAFPLLLLGDGTSVHATVAKVVGWAFAVWGTALYWWAGTLYVLQARRLLTTRTREVAS